MKFFEQKIKGVFLIEPEPFIDERGVFRRHFCKKEFEDHGITADVAQCNVSENKFKHTLRGFHYQSPPYGENKTLSCLRGSIYDIVVDLRPTSATYLKWLSFEVNENNRNSIHIPPGCANAFLTLKDNSIVHYYHSKPYQPGAESGVRYNDPFFNFKWPARPRIISDKDKNLPDFKPEKK